MHEKQEDLLPLCGLLSPPASSSSIHTKKWWKLQNCSVENYRNEWKTEKQVIIELLESLSASSLSNRILSQRETQASTREEDTWWEKSSLYIADKG